MAKRMLISTVSKEVGISTATIRNWANWGWIDEGERMPVGRGTYEYRAFNSNIVKIIKRAQKLQLKKGMKTKWALLRAAEEVKKSEEGE